METKRTKHNYDDYISRITAGNVQDDRVNTNTCTEWWPGILRTKRHTVYSRNEYIPRTCSRTAERKHKYIYRMTASEILKTKRRETFFWAQFIHRIKSTCCTCEFFNKLKLLSPGSGSWEFQLSRNANWFQIKLETVWLPIHNAL